MRHKKCACGCGERVTRSKNKFINHHACYSPEIQSKRLEKIQVLWDDPKFYVKRVAQIKKMRNTKEAKKLASERSKEIWNDPGYRELQLEYLKAAWKDPVSRAKRIKSLKKAAKKRWDDPDYREKMAQTMGHKMYDHGYIDTVKAGRVYHRSGWERAFILILDSSSIVKKFISEPFGIKYRDTKGHKHKYYPDFLVELIDGSKYIFELKGRGDVNWPEKRKAGYKYCDRHNYEYVVINENPVSLSKYIQ